MRGFFEELGWNLSKSHETRQKVKYSSDSNVSTVRAVCSTVEKGGACEACGLYRTCKSPKMPVSGEGRREILVVAEAPGSIEDQKGTQLVGKAGQYLRQILEEVGIDLDRDCWKTNAVICRPPNNRTPTVKEINYCRPYLLATVTQYQPKIMVLLGQVAFDSYLRHRLVGRIKDVTYKNWVDTIIPDQELKIWICTMYHPSYLVRMQGEREDKVLSRMYRRQFQRIAELTTIPFPDRLVPDVEITEDEQQAIAWIDELMHNPPEWVAFDYETTGLKPYAQGHGVRVISFCYGERSRAVFVTDAVKKAWRVFLRFCKHANVGLVCHNIAYEEVWSKEIFGVDLNVSKRWDTMLGARIINNRMACGLKYLVYTKFGVLGYDEDVDAYLSSSKVDSKTDGSCNAFNRIDEIDRKKLLRYAAEDSFFTYTLFIEQKKIFEKDMHIRRGAEFFFSAIGYLARMQSVGVCVDMNELGCVKKMLIRRLACIQQRIMDSDAVARWDKAEPFNFGSSTQLAHLLFDVLKVPMKVKTVAGNPSVDERVLEKLRDVVPVVKDVLEYRKWNKVLNTYLAQYEREVVDGLLHASFNLHTVDTFRSSSSDPNLQNVPNRDAQVRNVIRSIIKPRSGHRLVEYDYKALEVTVAGCIFQDPNWLSYCRDTSKDMHRDTAIEILYLTEAYHCPYDSLDSNLAKQARHAAKNGFVFPSIYGSSGKSAAASMWEQLPEEIKRHLREHVGIRNLEDFTERMIEYEREYWGKRYPVYGRRRKELYEFYERKGYIEQVTGFRCYGPLTFTQVVNYPVQGPASHIKLKTLVEVCKQIEQEKKDIFPVMEIHDSIVFDVNPEDEEWLDKTVYYYGTQKIRDDWDWIIAPLMIEKERSDVDGNWALMTECGYLTAR